MRLHNELSTTSKLAAEGVKAATGESNPRVIFYDPLSSKRTAPSGPNQGADKLPRHPSGASLKSKAVEKPDTKLLARLKARNAVCQDLEVLALEQAARHR